MADLPQTGQINLRGRKQLARGLELWAGVMALFYSRDDPEFQRDFRRLVGKLDTVLPQKRPNLFGLRRWLDEVCDLVFDKDVVNLQSNQLSIMDTYVIWRDGRNNLRLDTAMDDGGEYTGIIKWHTDYPGDRRLAPLAELWPGAKA